MNQPIKIFTLNQFWLSNKNQSRSINQKENSMATKNPVLVHRTDNVDGNWPTKKILIQISIPGKLTFFSGKVISGHCGFEQK